MLYSWKLYHQSILLHHKDTTTRGPIFLVYSETENAASYAWSIISYQPNWILTEGFIFHFNALTVKHSQKYNAMEGFISTEGQFSMDCIRSTYHGQYRYTDVWSNYIATPLFWLSLPNDDLWSSVIKIRCVANMFILNEDWSSYENLCMSYVFMPKKIWQM